jgi:hypothetical protein
MPLPSFCFVGALYVAWVLFYVSLFSVRTLFFAVPVSTVACRSCSARHPPQLIRNQLGLATTISALMRSLMHPATAQPPQLPESPVAGSPEAYGLTALNYFHHGAMAL